MVVITFTEYRDIKMTEHNDKSDPILIEIYSDYI